MKHSNRVWLALLTAAVVVLFPDVEKDVVKLPFSLGSVPAHIHSIVGFFILTILMISYCQSYAAAHKAVRIAHGTISKLESTAKQAEARSYFDMLVTSALSRAAPLPEFEGYPRISAVFYAILKSISIIVLFGIPSIATIVAFCRFSSDFSILIYLISLFVLSINLLAVLRLLYFEFLHSRGVFLRYWKNELIQQEEN